ncbi:carboxypeptidase-like regulatory domain-containing protein [bacterium]|nr:carboxypeptidase-like regulatory domain-containing protein [bacterium]
MVTDSATGDPIVGAQVQIVGSRWGDVTDSQGKYRIEDVLVGEYKIVVRAGGREARQSPLVRIRDERTSIYDIALAPQRPANLTIFAPDPDDVIRIRKLAERDYHAGRAVLSGIDDRKHLWDSSSGELLLIDTVSGLPIVSFDNIYLGRHYDQRMRELIDSAGPPANSRLPWLNQILHPERFFEMATLADGLWQLHVASDTTLTPDRTRLITAANIEEGVEMTTLDPSHHTITMRDVQEKGTPRWYQVPDTTYVTHDTIPGVSLADLSFIWGPEDSRLLFVKVNETKSQPVRFAVFDMELARWLTAVRK